MPKSDTPMAYWMDRIIINPVYLVNPVKKYTDLFSRYRPKSPLEDGKFFPSVGQDPLSG